MTAIIGLEHDGQVYIGGDGVVSMGTMTNRIVNPKVFVKKPMVMGYCHSGRLGNLLKYSLKIPKHPKGKNIFDYLVNDFVRSIQTVLGKHGFFDLEPSKVVACYPILLGYRGQLYEVNGDFQILKYQTNYCAIGSGTELALGSLHSTATIASLVRDPEKRIIMALEAASAFEGSVGPPFTVVKL